MKSAVPRSTTQMGGANNTWARTGRGERAPSETVSSWPFRACRSAARNGNMRTVRDLPVASLDDRVDFALTPEFFPSRIFPIRRPAAREEPARGGDGDELREETGSSVQEAFALVRHAHRRQVALDRPHAGPAHRGRRLVAAPGARRFARGRSDAARASRRGRRARDVFRASQPGDAHGEAADARARRPPRGRRLLAVRFPRRARRAGRTRIPASRGDPPRRCAAERFGSREDVFIRRFSSLSQVFEPIVHRRAFERGVRARTPRHPAPPFEPSRKKNAGALRGAAASAAGFGPPVAANPFAAAAKAAARTSPTAPSLWRDRRGRRK